MKVMIVDNVDSFVYNLYQYVGELGAEPVVVPTRSLGRTSKASRLTASSSALARASLKMRGAVWTLFISSARRYPPWAFASATSASVSLSAAPCPAPRRPCTARRASSATTGKASMPGSADRSRPRAIIRWPSSRPASQIALKVTAISSDGEIMGVRHREYPIEGVQFHPSPS